MPYVETLLPDYRLLVSVKSSGSPANVIVNCLHKLAHLHPCGYREKAPMIVNGDYPYPYPSSGATHHTWTSSPRYFGESSISPYFGRRQPQYHILLSCTSPPTSSSTPHYFRSSAKSLRHTCPSSFWILVVRLAVVISPLCSSWRRRFVSGRYRRYIRVVLCPR